MGNPAAERADLRIFGNRRNPTAVPAVARADRDNRIAILIPCHRVIGKNGKPVGYGGGLWRKQYLLDLKREHAAG